MEILEYYDDEKISDFNSHYALNKKIRNPY